MPYKRGIDPAGDWLLDHGEHIGPKGKLREQHKPVTAESVSPAQIKGNTRGRQGPRINLRKVSEVLLDYGMDPTVEICKVIPDLDHGLRAKVLLELLSYVQPKMKSIEINATVTELSPEQRKQRIEQLLKKGK